MAKPGKEKGQINENSLKGDDESAKQKKEEKTKNWLNQKKLKRKWYLMLDRLAARAKDYGWYSIKNMLYSYDFSFNNISE